MSPRLSHRSTSPKMLILRELTATWEESTDEANERNRPNHQKLADRDKGFAPKGSLWKLDVGAL